MRRCVALLSCAILLTVTAFAGETREAKIGLPVLFSEVVVEGSELEGLPIDPKAPFHARVVAVRPHGSAFRYDIECVALESGEYDARLGLRRKDGSKPPDAPVLAFVARSNLEAGLVRPHTPGEGRVPALGGYRTWLFVAACVWCVGLAWLLLSGRRKRRAQAGSGPARPPTLVERLTLLVERARDGKLGDSERTELEMALVAYWRRRLNLEDGHASELLPLLRAHPDAGPLLRGLEQWLHAPGGAHAVDVPALLAPYRGLADDAIDLPAAR